MNANARSDFVIIYSRQTIEAYDDPIRFGIEDPTIHEGFEWKRGSDRVIPYLENKFRNIITYEVSTAAKRYYRSVYSLSDLISEVGGFVASISGICAFLVAIVHYFGSYWFVMNDIFYNRSLVG